MAKIIKLFPNNPTEALKEVFDSPPVYGPAKCLLCKHEWEEVAPIGIIYFKCPNCGTKKGVFMFPIEYPDQDEWSCNCGNSLFKATGSGIYCSNCGKWQYGF